MTHRALVSGLLFALVSGAITIAASGATPARALPEVSAACAPSGPRLAFIRDLGPSVGFEIFTVRPDGTGLKRLTHNVNDEWRPTWSPDGSKIAFSSTRDGNSEIYVMGRGGSGITRLTVDDASDGVPAWSPDGTKIAFSSSRENPMNLDNDLFVMDADGNNVMKIAGGPRSEANASWSPNGQRIAFDRSDSIFTIRLDGTDLKKLTNRRRMLASNPSWSNEGRHILFQAQTSEEKGMDVFVMRSDGSNKVTLRATKREEQNPTWSPNDRRIAFTNNWRMATAKRDGSRPVTFFRHNLADYTVDWGKRVTCPSRLDSLTLGGQSSGPRGGTDAAVRLSTPNSSQSSFSYSSLSPFQTGLPVTK